jgi:hypothetical protein
MLIIVPLFFLRYGTECLVHRNTPVRFIEIVLFQSSKLSSVIGEFLGAASAALLTNTSMPPKLFFVSLIKFLTESSSETSV